MKKVFVILTMLLFSNIALAELKPVPPYAGDDPWMPKLSRWGEIQALEPQVHSEADQAKLAEAKQRLKNALINYKNFQASIKKNNAHQAALIKQYEHIFDRLWDNYLNNAVKNHIYDKEFVELLDKALRHNYQYFSDVYKEQGTDIFWRKVNDVNTLRTSLKSQEYIVNKLKKGG